ncbi:hypothetical protein DID96_31360 [Burkholderia sp. Bp8963]|nr:hypothetical protein DID96_31360 [Burkholderia sp. Bp8963]
MARTGTVASLDTLGVNAVFHGSAASAAAHVFHWHGLRGTRLAPSHVAEIIITSTAIPPVSLCWHVRGTTHFRATLL